MKMKYLEPCVPGGLESNDRYENNTIIILELIGIDQSL